KRGYLCDVRTLYSFALRRGYVTVNPAKGVELPVLADGEELGEIAIHTPEEARTILEFARGRNLNLMRMLAIRYFCGLRTEEALRLREEDINKNGNGLIIISAKNSKTRSRRLIEISESLKAWLALGGELNGTVSANTLRLFKKAVAVECKVAWPKNA